MSGRPMAAALAGVVRLRGVRAALVTTSHDALPIEVVAHVDVDPEALAAFGVSLLRRARQAAEATALGGVSFLSLDATAGRLFVAASDEVLVLALAERDAHPGLVRVTLQRCLTALA